MKLIFTLRSSFIYFFKISKFLLTLFFVALISTGVVRAQTVTLTTTIDEVNGNTTSIAALISTPGGAGISLREAIIAANNTAGANTILFSAALNGTPITLTLPGANENNSATGDLDIKDALTITGNGPSNTIVQAGTNNSNGIDKVFSINPSFTLAFATTITGITIRFGKNPSAFSGDGFGGGLDWEGSGTGTLLIDNCVITDNKTTDGDGGGLTVTNTGGGTASVTITNSTISNNTPARAAAASPIGGGIFVGTTTAIFLTNCTISGNSVAGSAGQGQGGGIFIFGPGGAAGQSSLTNCIISNNTSPSDGGGIYSTTPLTINATTFSGNNSGRFGGGLFINHSNATTTISKNTFINNNATTRGGGIYLGTSTTSNILNVSYSRFAGNTSAAQNGVAIADGAATLQNNWWGCNLGPSNAGCNQAAVFGTGSINFTPWLVLNHTASPTTICSGANSTFTASFLLNSSGGAVAATNLDVLIGQPITFNAPVNGTLSAAQTTIQPSGTATVTFTGTTPGSGSANAVFVLAVENFTVTTSPTITVSGNNTAGAPSSNPTVCINTAISPNITIATTGATGIGAPSLLPAGVSAAWVANVITISGTPLASGTFNYSIPLTGGCGGAVNATGTITVSPNNTISLTSAPGTNNQTVLVNTPITNITYATTGATGATFSGLPPGVTGNWAANVVTISGTPSTVVGSPFNYTVNLTGGCGTVTASGTITVINCGITLTSAPGTNAQAVCINTPITNITYSTTGATGATVTGLPTGVTGSWAANVVTITGTPTTAVGSPFNYTVTLTGGGCGAVTANGTITVNLNPSPAANAGPDQTVCATLVTLAANTPTVGTGAWSIISGAGGSVTTPSSPSSALTGVAGTTYTLRWTISNAGCVPSTDDVVINLTANPTTANAGPDQTVCATSVTLAANTPTVGTGAWSIISGAGGSVTTPSSPTSTFTGVAGTTYTLRWTISNAPCTPSTDDVVINLTANPTTANAGSDQTVCGSSATLAANTPTVGTGAWSIISGAGGSVTTPSSPTSAFTGVAGTTYTLRWTISNAPCVPSTDDVVIDLRANPTIANAGSDQTICGTSATLAANTPTVGTGAWSIISGAGGTVTTPASPTSAFTGVAGTSYTLRWTISNAPCTPSADDVVINLTANPSTANAGSDQTVCGSSATLAANTPTVGTGAWSIISGAGGSVTTPSSPTSAFTGVAGTTYTLRWTISNAPCAPSTDDVVIDLTANPTTANAGPDQAVCATSATLAANTPTVGTGAWSIISGAGGTVTTPASPTSTFTGVAGTSYTLRWTISNAPCTPSTDDVVITLSANPTTANAGPDQTVCGSSANLAANTPTVGTGLWSIISGVGGTVTAPSSPTSTFTGIAGTSYTLRWTISNAPCTASTDDVVINLTANPTTANAGPDQTVCVTSVTLAANTPTVGTGAWSIISGVGGMVATTSSPTSGFTGVLGSVYTLRWTISNAPCTPSTDDVVISLNATPTISCPGNIAQNNTTGQCGRIVTYSTTVGGLPTPTQTYTFSGATPGSGAGNGSGSFFAVGTTTVTVTATNVCGNVSCSFTVTITDNEPPIVTTGTIASCYLTAAAAQAAALAATSATDNCPGTLTETATTAGTCSAVVTVRTSDVAGNFIDVTYSTRIDNTPPTVTTGSISSCYPTAAAAEAAALAATSANDNCPGTLTETASTAGTCSAVVTVTTTDGCGNAISVTYNTRIDNTAPTVSTGTIASCYPSVAAAEAAALAATSATDNCPGALTETASTAGTCTAVVTVTTTDGCGNAIFVTYNTRIDNTAPSLTCPANVTISCIGSTAPTATGTATAIDNCTPTSPTITFSDVSTQGQGCSQYSYVIIRTWKATDACGNMSTCSQTITVQDLVAPTIACPPNVTRQCDQPTDPGSTGNATATGDNCATIPQIAVTFIDVSSQTASGCTNDSYVITRTWRATDPCGNFSTCVQTITVVDNTPPTIVCPANTTIQCSVPTTPANTGMATAVDNCSPLAEIAITFTDASTQTATGCGNDNYVITRTWRATDACGNFSTCVQTINVVDTTPPLITCPANVSIACSASTAPAATGTATATDACSATVTITSSDVTTQTAGGCSNDNYQIFRTWRATDACGNFSTCVQTITVSDTQAPVITCPPNQTLSCFQTVPAPFTTAAAFIAGGGTITDNCSTNLADFTVFVQNVDNGNDNCPGNARVVTRTYFVQDACLNTTSCTQTFTYLASTQGPVITSVIPTCFKFCASLANPMESDITYTTDCSFGAVVNITGPQQIGATNCPGTIYRYTYTVTDDCGRTSAPVTRDFIIGNDGPTITCPPFNLFLECGDENNAQYLEDHFGTVLVNTSCELGYTLTYTPQNFNNIACGSSTIVTFTVTDACGRTATCSTTVSIMDNTAPTIVSVPPSVCDITNCSADEVFWFNHWKNYMINGIVATDACDNDVSVTAVNTPLNTNCPNGTAVTIVTFVATDNCGNETEITGTFTVEATPSNLNILGKVATEAQEAVQSVEVTLAGSNISSQMMETGVDGLYGFNGLLLGDNYSVTPYSNDNPLNGVSSYDLVLISKHILQTEFLDSPYKMIAADINRSGSVTTLDMLELRKLILHIDEEFANNTSWRFVEAAFVFPEPNNPFATLFPEAVFINGLTESEEHDFVGVKIGDVNGSAVPNAFAGVDDRTFVDELVFQVKDQELKAGATYEVAFRADNFEAVHGYQFTLNFDKQALTFAGLRAGDLTNMTESNFGTSLLDEGAITTSWTNQTAQSLTRDAAVFYISFTANADVLLSEAIAVSSRYTKAEAYDANLDLMEVRFRFDTDEVAIKDFRLYQNTPNPFKAETVIGFDLPADMFASLRIFDAAGRQVKLVEGDFVKGYNQVSISRAELGTRGLLYYQLVTADFEQTKKMIVAE